MSLATDNQYMPHKITFSMPSDIEMKEDEEIVDDQSIEQVAMTPNGMQTAGGILRTEANDGEMANDIDMVIRDDADDITPSEEIVTGPNNDGSGTGETDSDQDIHDINTQGETAR